MPGDSPRRIPRAAIRGEPFFYPDAITALMRDYLQRAQRGEPVPQHVLTARENEVLKLIAEFLVKRDR